MTTAREIMTGAECLREDATRGRTGPSTLTAGDLAQGKPVPIGADDDVSDALGSMKVHRMRRLPVTDDHYLLGVLMQPDVARSLPDDRVAGVGAHVRITSARRPRARWRVR